VPPGGQSGSRQHRDVYRRRRDRQVGADWCESGGPAAGLHSVRLDLITNHGVTEDTEKNLWKSPCSPCLRGLFERCVNAAPRVAAKTHKNSTLLGAATL